MGRNKMKSKPVDTESETNKVKRKHIFLTILQKVEILEKLDNGVTPDNLADIFGISTRAVSDIRKSKEKILNFYAKCSSRQGMTNRKTLHGTRCSDFDDIVYGWLKQRQSEGVPITGLGLREKAKQLYKDLRIKGNYDFSEKWLKQFKARHAILDLENCEEKASDKATVKSMRDAAEGFIEVFSKMVSKENMSPEQIYNFGETALLWRCLPLKTLVKGSENIPEDVKESKESMTVLICSNAAGSHKCKPLLAGKSPYPWALKNCTPLPVIYKGNKKSCITREIILDWFRNHFVKEARRHCKNVGLLDDCKIVLLLENRPEYPDVDLLASSNVICITLPPNTATLIQPMNQSIINSWKCHYKAIYLKRLLKMDPSLQAFEFYQKSFNLREAVCIIVRAWESVSKNTLKSAWYDLWPYSVFFDSGNEDEDFDGFELPEVEKKASELLLYAKKVNSSLSNAFQQDAIIDWLSSINEDPADKQEVTDDEIISNVLYPLTSDMDTSESDCEETEVTFKEGLKSGELYLKFLKEQKFVSEQEIMTIHAIQEKLHKQKLMF